MDRKTLLRWGIPLLLFFFSFFIRWHAYPDYLFFGFEQGRDAIVAKDIYTLKHFPFTGPKTDLDGVFHGPWYYYMIAIPYFLSSGNPVVASLFLVLAGSTVPVILYLLVMDITRSRAWGVIAAMIGALSYELILFSRWLSNVSLAMPSALLAFFFLWKYREKKKPLFFLYAVAFAALAIQFEIILIGMIGFAAIAMFARFIRFPKQRIFLAGAGIFLAIFLPLILFTVKNRSITIRSVSGYFSGAGEKTRVFNAGQSISIYIRQNTVLFKRTLMYTQNNLLFYSFLAIFLIGLFLYMGQGKKERQTIVFLAIWFFMSLPLLLLSDVVGLSQAYVGIAPSLIIAFTLALRTLWKQRTTKILVALSSVLLLVSFYDVSYSLNTNRDVFFKTIQDDLNYTDQKNILQWIHDDANGKPYRLEEYTIPYFQPQGWQYLHEYYYPKDSASDTKVIYIVIEEKVDPFWEHMWTNDLGSTTC